MRYADNRNNVTAAMLDLENRSLRNLPGDFTRLIYLASTRDYNDGHYYHEGLSRAFTPEAAESALAAWHSRLFEKVALLSLEELLKELDTYISAAHLRGTELLASWQALEPYRVAVPLGSDPLARAIFFSNVRIALAILETQQLGN